MEDGSSLRFEVVGLVEDEVAAISGTWLFKGGVGQKFSMPRDESESHIFTWDELLHENGEIGGERAIGEGPLEFSERVVALKSDASPAIHRFGDDGNESRVWRNSLTVRASSVRGCGNSRADSN